VSQQNLWLANAWFVNQGLQLAEPAYTSNNALLASQWSCEWLSINDVHRV